MTVSKKVLVMERQTLEKDFNALAEQIKQSELSLNNMKNNLNALHGAIQQVDKLLGMINDNGADVISDIKTVPKSEESTNGEIIQKS